MKPARRIALEICVDDAAGLLAAVRGGADRIELCSSLALGGLTPTAGLMALAARVPVPVYAMIRPHAGSFVFSRDDLDSMRADIDAVRAAGLAGIVLGASRTDGRLDGEALGALVAHARTGAGGLGLTLHRAFDLVPDFGEALETAVALGFERILSAGGEADVGRGLDALAGIVSRAGNRISIMPGSGVRPQTLAPLLDRLAVREVHSSASAPRAAAAAGKAGALGFEGPDDRRTDERVVRELRRMLDAA